MRDKLESILLITLSIICLWNCTRITDSGDKISLYGVWEIQSEKLLIN